MIYYGRNEKHLKILNIMESVHKNETRYRTKRLGRTCQTILLYETDGQARIH
jgi:hypothetical protein